MSTRIINRLILIAAIIGLALLLSGCQSATPSSVKAAETPAADKPAQSPPPPAKQVKTEKPISPDAIPQPKLAYRTAAAPASHTKPTEDEVKDLVSRIFENDVVLDSTGASEFIVGDFNGDGFEDIAITVKPAQGKTVDLNSEVANWTIGAPRKVEVTDVVSAVKRLPANSLPERIDSADQLLAVIHGFGPNGWRDPNARQAYLLKNVVGKDVKSRTSKDLPQSVLAKPIFTKHAGDVITEVLDAQPGFIFWNGSQYAWFHEDK
ncbi:MAG TPA: hypothetical protein VFC63_09290 [Blastocatellia bacterium]|nr:hypothetical protein [Blastocatellia bacterium]